MTQTCAHCGQLCGTYQAGYSSMRLEDGSLVFLCHPNDPGRPDCYRLVTVGGEQIGALRERGLG